MPRNDEGKSLGMTGENLATAIQKNLAIMVEIFAHIDHAPLITLSFNIFVVRGFSLVHDPEGSHYKYFLVEVAHYIFKHLGNVARGAWTLLYLIGHILISPHL